MGPEKQKDQMGSEMKQDMNDHDWLIRIDERVQKLDRCFSNHLYHHWTITIALLVAVLGLITKIMWL